MGQPVNLIDEKNVLLVKIGQDCCQISWSLDNWFRCYLDINAHFSGHDIRKGCFAETWRTIQKNVIEGITSLFRSFNEYGKILFDLFLSDILPKAFGAEG